MGCDYGHKVRCTNPLGHDMLLAEWSSIKEYCFFQAIGASLSCLSWAQESYILLSWSTALPLVGCICLPGAQFSALQREYQMPVCGIQERTYIQSWQCPALWGEHIVHFTLLTPKHDTELTVHPRGPGPDSPLHFTCHGCAMEINEVTQPENWGNRDWPSLPEGASVHWWEKQSL